MKKSVQCAVCLIPPVEVWASIQAMRERFDPAFHRWMPHINLLYPFVPPEDVDSVVDRLDACLEGVSAFEVEFNEFGTFQHGKSSATMFLEPSPKLPIVELQQRLVLAFPDHNDLNVRGDHGFAPHLTVAKVKGDKRKMESVLSECNSLFQNIKFVVNDICVIVREKDTPFEVVHRRCLNNASK